MKQILLFTVLIAASLADFAQTISPATTNEYCWGVNYDFSLSISGKATSVGWDGDNTGLGYSYVLPNLSVMASFVTDGAGNVTSTNVTIHVTFVNYVDPSVAQGFRLSYFDAQNVLQHTVRYIFNKIKLIPGAPALGIGAINRALCDQSPLTVSFQPLSYKTEVTSSSNNQVTFKAITQYEYAVPVGWQVNGTVSTGADTYILGTTSATITPDGVSGNGGAIKVRAVGECNDRGPVSQIAITRPGLSITGADEVCTNPVTYSVANLPSGSSVTWQPGIGISIVSATATTVTVQSSGSFNGIGTLGATVTLPCSVNTIQVSRSVAVGKVLIDLLSASNTASSTNTNSFCPTNTENSVTVTLRAGARAYRITIDIYGIAANGQPITSTHTTKDVVLPGGISTSQTITSLSLPVTNNGFYKITATVYNSCNQTTISNLFAQQSCSTGGGGGPQLVPAADIQTYPNPAGSSVTVQWPVSAGKSPGGTGSKTITMRDAFGKQVFRTRVVNVNRETINISSIPAGTYFVEVSDGIKRSVQKIVVVH